MLRTTASSCLQMPSTQVTCLRLPVCRWLHQVTIPGVPLAALPPWVRYLLKAQTSFPRLGAAPISLLRVLSETSLPSFFYLLHQISPYAKSYFLITSCSFLPGTSRVATTVTEPNTWQQRQTQTLPGTSFQGISKTSIYFLRLTLGWVIQLFSKHLPRNRFRSWWLCTSFPSPLCPHFRSCFYFRREKK